MDRWTFEPELRLLDQLRGGMGRLVSDFFAAPRLARGNGWRFERAYPALEFAWPDVSDPGTVFVLAREQLPPPAKTA